MKQMLFVSGDEIQWYRDESQRIMCLVIIVLVTILFQFLYLYNESKHNLNFL